MLPVIVEIGWLKVHSYGLMLAIGFITGAWLLRRELRRWHLPEDLADRAVIGAMLGGIIGAKLYYAFINVPDEFARRPFAVLFSGSGLTYYGGLIGATLVLVWTFRRAKVSILHMADLLLPLVVLGYGFGRWGCFLSGDGDYGPPSDVPWALAFPNGTVPTTVPVHPTPLYEVALMWAAFAFLWFVLRPRNPARGILLAASLVLMGVERLFTEFWRIDSGRYIDRITALDVPIIPTTEAIQRAALMEAHRAHYGALGLSIAQLLSIALIIIGVAIIWFRRGAAPQVIPGGAVAGRSREPRKA